MRLKTFFLFFFYMCFLWGGGSSAFAHKVNLFGYVENGYLLGEGYYSGGRPAKECVIDVYSVGRESPFASTQTDAEGRFKIKIETRKGPLRIVMNAGQGHKTEFVIEQQIRSARPDRSREPGGVLILGGLAFIAVIFTLIYFVKKKVWHAF